MMMEYAQTCYAILARDNHAMASEDIRLLCSHMYIKPKILLYST